MWKDSMPEILKYAVVKPCAMQSMPTSASLGASGYEAAPAAVARAAPVAVARAAVSGVQVSAPAAAGAPPRVAELETNPNLEYSAADPGAASASSTSSTIRLIVQKARGLMAADWCGTSDPYVICENVGTGEKVQTKHVRFTCNPDWNETFILHRCLADGLLLRFTLMDYDFGRKDDPLGTAELTADRLSADGKFEGQLDVLYSESGGGGGKASGTLSISVQRCHDLSISFEE